MVEYTTVVNDYAQGRLMHVSMTAIIDQKNGTQFALMSLRAANAHLPDPRIIEPLYEACRLAAIIYSILVVLPWPASTAPFPELAIQLEEELNGGDIMKDSPRAPELLLWILFMGGIASIGLAQRTWYVEGIGSLAKKMNLVSSEKIKEIMMNFLWLGSTSDGDGLELWNDVLLFNRERDERRRAGLTGSLPLF
jgi:Fungal specific transcription factor domain